MSSVFLSFGPRSGFLTGHMLNSLIECTDSPPNWYCESAGGLLPNVVFFDNAKSVRFYSDYEDIEDKITKNETNRSIQKLNLPQDGSIIMPKFKPTPFIEYIKKGGKTFIPLDEPRPNFGLEHSDIAWCDMINFNMSRRSFVEIPGTDIEPLNTYIEGYEKAAENENFDHYTDPIRRNFESCDRVASVIITADRNTGYGGFSAKIADYILEEIPKAVRFVFHTADEVDSDAVAANASLALASALDFAHIHSVLIPPETNSLPPIIDSSKYKADNIFSRTALLSMPLLSGLLPMLNGGVRARQYLDVLAPTPILKFVSISAAFPAFDKPTLYSFPAEERVLSSITTLAGVGADAREGILSSMKPESPYFYEAFEHPQPLFVGLTMPHFFADRAVTADGQKPTERPPSLSVEDYERLIKAGVIKRREGVPCDRLRLLSAAAKWETSASLAEKLENASGFIRSSPAITHDISISDASHLADVVMNIVDGLKAESDA